MAIGVAVTLVLALPLAAAIFVVVKYDEITDVMAILSPLIGLVALLIGGGGVYLLTRQASGVVQDQVNQLQEDRDRERTLRQQAETAQNEAAQALHQATRGREEDRRLREEAEARWSTLRSEVEPLRAQVESMRAELSEARQQYRTWAEWAYWIQRELPQSKVEELQSNWGQVAQRWNVTAEPPKGELGPPVSPTAGGPGGTTLRMDWMPGTQPATPATPSENRGQEPEDVAS